MRILHVATERRSAESAALALRGIAQNLTYAWAQSLGSALTWVRANREVAALLVESEVHGLGCASFIREVRSLGSTVPIVVIAPAHAGTHDEALRAGAQACITEGPSFEADLSRVLSALLRQAAGTGQTSAHGTGSSPDLAGADQRELEARLAEAEAWKKAAADRMARAERALREAEQRHASELAAAAGRLAEARAEHEASLARATRICTALQERLLELEAAIRAADEQRASEAAAASEQLARRHAEFAASLFEVAQRREALARKLSEAIAAADHERRARTAEAAAAADRLSRRESELHARLSAAAEREAALEDRLAQETASRSTVEQKLAASEAARQESEARHATELARASERLSLLQQQYEASVSEHAAARAAFERQLADAAAALERAAHERAAEASAAADRLARREAELNAAIDEAAGARAALERRLEEAEAEHQRTKDLATADLAAAAERERALARRLEAEEAAHHGTRERAAADLAAAAGRQAALEARVHEAVASRSALERELADSRSSARRRRQRSLALISAYRRRSRAARIRLETALADERADSARILAARDEEIRRLAAENDSLRGSVESAQRQLTSMHEALDDERQARERVRAAGEAEIQRLTAECEEMRRGLDQMRTAFQTLERVANDHASERVRLERVIADRDAELSARAAQYDAAERSARSAIAALEEDLRTAAAASSAEIARLRSEMGALRGELSASRTLAARLQQIADRVPVLETQLEEARKDIRRRFERAPYGICHCTRDGRIANANHSLAKLLGFRKADDLRDLDLAPVAFESPADLRWLIEQAINTGRPESVETTWKTKHGRRLLVRLQAVASADGIVEIVVADITTLRALEQRLRQAHRMEAVGRVAAELAVTCETVLRDVTRDGQHWLATMGSDAMTRRQGELLFSEVTRAAGFLQQFAVYGSQQSNGSGPVNLHRTLRDLQPVLEEIAGTDIELVLPRTSTSLDVDVDAERVERILVNVASYARQRMREGGRIRIDLATTVVGRRFIARYPNVRPGPHALITVSEVRLANPALASNDSPVDQAQAHRDRSAARPGVDVGALLGLVGHCGGHLWMEAASSGNLTVKIHLPKRVPDELGALEPSLAVTGAHDRQIGWLRRSLRPASRHVTTF